MTPTLSDVPVEVMAHLLGWMTEPQWLQLRGLSRKWRSAVGCRMEGELSAQTSSDGTWKPPLRRTIARRLLLVSTPFMSPELKLGSAAYLGDGLSCQVAEREIVLIADHFQGLEQFVCPETITDTGLGDLAKRFPLKSLGLISCTRVTDLGLHEVSKFSALKSLDLTQCFRITDGGLAEVAKLRTLTSLSLNGCFEITDAGLHEVAKLSALTSLDLSHCREISNSGLGEVAAKLDALLALNLRGCAKIGTPGWTWCRSS
jgi:hypothetical protein